MLFRCETKPAQLFFEMRNSALVKRRGGIWPADPLYDLIYVFYVSRVVVVQSRSVAPYAIKLNHYRLCTARSAPLDPADCPHGFAVLL